MSTVSGLTGRVALKSKHVTFPTPDPEVVTVDVVLLQPNENAATSMCFSVALLPRSELPGISGMNNV